MTAASLSPNFNFDEYGINSKGNNKRNEDDFLRLQSSRFAEYAGRYSEIALKEMDVKQQFKDLDKSFKLEGFDATTAKRGIKTYLRRLKKPDEAETINVIHEWIEQNKKVLASLRDLVDVDEEIRQQWELSKEDHFNSRLKKIGDVSKDNYLRAITDLNMSSDDFSREDIAKRAHFGDESAAAQLFEMDRQAALASGKVIDMPDYIKKIQSPKEYSKSEINSAEVANATCLKALEDFMEKWEISPDEEYWLDLNIPTKDLCDFEMEVITPWYRVPKDLRDPEMEEVISLIKEYERYTAKWFDYMSSRLNPAMATILPIRLKTKGDINKFGTTEEKAEKYLKWCTQFKNEEYIFFEDPNFKDDPTLTKNSCIRKVYIGGYPYPKDIVKSGHPNGQVAGVFEYPEEPSGFYELDQTDLFLGQPYFKRDDILVPEYNHAGHRWIKTDAIRKVLDVKILQGHEIEELKTRAQFGKDYFVHLVNEQHLSYDSMEDKIDAAFTAFVQENLNSPKGEMNYNLILKACGQVVELCWDFKEAKFKKVILEESPSYETTYNPVYADMHGILSKEDFFRKLQKINLNNIILEYGYKEKEDLIYQENFKLNPYLGTINSNLPSGTIIKATSIMEDFEDSEIIDDLDMLINSKEAKTDDEIDFDDIINSIL